MTVLLLFLSNREGFKLLSSELVGADKVSRGKFFIDIAAV